MTVDEFIKTLNKKIADATFLEIVAMYKQDFVLTFGSMQVEIPFDAVAFNALTDALERIRKEA